MDFFTAEALHEATAALTDLGPRMVTTPEEDAARAVIEALFTDAGLADVVAEPFVWDAWVPGTASVTAGGNVYAGQPLSPSPETAALSAPLRDGEPFTGEIALLHSDDGGRADHVLQAMLGGADGWIRVTDDRDHDGGSLIEVGHTLAGSSLPAVAVDAETGAVLDALVGEPATLDLTSTMVLGHTSHNVLGTVPGSGPGTVYVTGHYDSWHPSESAFDNAIGVGAMVLMARDLAAGPTPRSTVVFLATSGEEQGLTGANMWVEAHEAEAAAAAFVLNIDVPWAGEGDFFLSATEPGFIEVAGAAADAEGLAWRDGGLPGIGSDHVPFVTRGVSAMWNTRCCDRHYHTEHDTLDNLDLDEAIMAVRVNHAVLKDVAGVAASE